MLTFLQERHKLKALAYLPRKESKNNFDYIPIYYPNTK